MGLVHDLSAEFDRYRPRATDDATDLARLRELAATAEAGHAVDGPPRGSTST